MARFSLKWLFMGVAVVAVSVFAVLRVNEWWIMAIRSAVFASVLVALWRGSFKHDAFLLGYSSTVLVKLLFKVVFAYSTKGLDHQIIALIDSAFYRLSLWNPAFSYESPDLREDMLELQLLIVTGVAGGLVCCWLKKRNG